MANAMTKKEYDEVKNERFAVIGFLLENMRRNYSYGGLSLYQAQKEIQKTQHSRQFCIIVSVEQYKAISKYENQHCKGMIQSVRITLQEALMVIENTKKQSV